MICREEKPDWGRIASLHFASGDFLRNLAKRKVSRVEFGGRCYVVKSYRMSWWRRILGIGPGSTAGSRLLAGLTPPCLADFIQDGWQVTIYPDAGKANFYYTDTFLAEVPEPVSMYGDAGRLMAEMHLRNLYHADAKPTNFVVNTLLQDFPPVVIVDCDRVLCYRVLPEHRRVFNLAQFLAGNKELGEPKLLDDCLRSFLLAYQERCNLPVSAMRDLLQKAVDVALANPRVEKHLPPDRIAGLASLLG